jgi:hypothetical protein
MSGLEIAIQAAFARHESEFLLVVACVANALVFF